MSVIPDILVTTAYFLLTLGSVQLFRYGGRIISRAFGMPFLISTCYQEALAAFELCAICYEIGILLDYENGVWIYALYLFIASAWWDLVWCEATAAPYTYVVKMIFEKSTSTFDILITIASQLFGGMAFYSYYIKPLWMLGYGNLHMERIASEEICLTDIQSPVPVAALVEGGGVLISILTAKIAGSFLKETSTAIIDSFVGTSLVVAALNISGGYYNSILATSTLWGCFGSSAAEHFFVYWIAQTIGAIFAHIIWEQIFNRHSHPHAD